jgi:hypothetical protein
MLLLRAFYLRTAESASAQAYSPPAPEQNSRRKGRLSFIRGSTKDQSSFHA